MKRIDPLLRIAQAENDILKKYFEARRIRIYYREDGCPENWELIPNKRGHRSPTILDQNAFRALEIIWKETSDLHPQRYHIACDQPVPFMYDIIGGYPDKSYSGRSIVITVMDAYENTVRVEDETGNFVYEYEEDENESDGEPNDE